MSVAFYLDHNVSPAVARGLRRRDVDVVMAHDDGATEMPDEELLSRATLLGRVVFSQDHDFLTIATRWLNEGRGFAGLVYCRQRRLSVGQITEQLELIAKLSDPVDLANNVVYLPL